MASVRTQPTAGRRHDADGQRTRRPAATRTSRVLVVDGHPFVLAGLSALLGREPGLEVVATASDVAEATAAARRLKPDVVVSEVDLPDGDGVALCASLVARAPRTRVVLFARMAGPSAARRALEAGAAGFVGKTCDLAVLRQAVRAVATGEVFIDPAIAATMATVATSDPQSVGPYGLTPQQAQILEMLPQGLSNAAIGERLGITEETVKTHLRLALRKLGARSRVEAAAIAQRTGLA